MQYDNLSTVYDKFNDGFSYESYLKNIFNKFDLPSEGLVLDSGCGTGTLICKLSSAGYDCTGVDSSENMLQCAYDKISGSGFVPHLICQDITELDLYGAYDIVFCSLDTVNHILDKRQLKHFFKNLYNFVEDNGWFIFDTKTKKGFLQAKENIIREENGNMLVVQGDFDGKYAAYEFNMFAMNTDGTYTRTSETIDERFYAGDEIKYLLKISGFEHKGTIQTPYRTVTAAKKIFKE